MTDYADSSFLVALYLPEAHAAAAQRSLHRVPQPLGVTPLHELEVRNAMRLRRFRREISESEYAAALADWAADHATGVLALLPVPWPATWREAERLSATQTATLGCRSLDLLHVACALAVGAKTFLTFDGRQRQLAQGAELKVKP